MDDLPAQIAADPAALRGVIIDPQPGQSQDQCDHQGEEVVWQHSFACWGMVYFDKVFEDVSIVYQPIWLAVERLADFPTCLYMVTLVNGSPRIPS
jgi:hypothetical protein